MQNKGTDYIRRLLKDKARLKRWRKMMLCLSCIVVFCTVYVLILPAITLERKTTCGQEEHVHTEECYSADNLLICGREEHIHTEMCYTKDEDSKSPTDNSEQNLSLEDEDSIVEEDNGDEVKFVSGELPDEANEDTTAEEDPPADMTAVDELDDGETATPSSVPNQAGGFDLSASTENIDSVTLQYYDEQTKNWITVQESGSGEIPGNAPIKLSVKYKDIPVDTLMINYNRKLTYTLPNLLRNVTANGTIMDGTQSAGKVTVGDQDNKIIIEFEEPYLNNLKIDGKTKISGDFYVEGRVKLSELPANGQTTLSTANKNYQLNFGEDAIARYGQINISKTCTSDKTIIRADGNYLSYTITVTAGEDGCPDVSVVDTIMNSSNCVESYLETDNPENVTVTEPGSMVWKIGNMAAGESRTLTYYVKLKDNVALNGNEIKNKADVYSKTYQRAYGEAFFIPKIAYEMTKDQVGNTVRDKKNGTYTISYRLNFTLKKGASNYALKNFEFRDLLDAGDIYTDKTALPYISYNRDSVKLYVKKDEDADYTPVSKTDYIVSWANGNDSYETSWNDSNNNPTRFRIKGADGKQITVNPGDSYYVTYTIIVKPEALAAMQANNVDVKNRYYVYASNAKNKQFNYEDIDRVWHKARIDGYTWDKKVVGTGTKESQTITMNGDTYDLTSGKIIQETSTENSFTVPAGSYPYTVDVNQTLGDWDATEVSMTDTLSSDKMKYIGYAKVEAYEYNADDKAYEVKGTKWVKIDELNSFTLRPSDLGWKVAKYAYKFTYYAKPIDSNFSEVTVNNTFSLSGNVKRGENEFSLDGIRSQGEVTISGSFKMNVKKEAWYYEEPKTGATTWKNGKLYWVIEVSGTAILPNTYFQDAISKDSGLTDSYLHSDSLAGIYMGTLPDDKVIIGYSSLEDLLQTREELSDVKNMFEAPELTNTKNFSSGNYSELTVKANERIELGNKKLYFIIRTEPQSLPTQYRDAFTYRNHIRTRDSDNTWIEYRSADKLLCGGADILKKLGQTFTYDGTTVISNKEGADKGDSSKIAATALPGAGQYVSWVFKVNYAGELSGTYRALETIPDGMELAYIRIKWVGTGQDFNAISSKKIEGLDSDGWTEKTIKADTDNGNQSKETTYYVKGNQALIKLGDFTAKKERDNYSVDVQVVCKVTDPDVLLGGVTKEFKNQVTLQTETGEEINTAISSASVTPKKLEKEITSTGSEKIGFTIKANQLGETLPTEKGETLTLIDKLSSTLILDTGTIEVINSKTKENVTYTASLDANNTLKIVIPRDKPVTITYTARVNAPPKQAVSFSNEAYWENYSPASGTSVKQENYSYNAGGTVAGATSVTLKIVKKDQNDLSNLLSGAAFEVVSCTRQENGTIVENENPKWSGTTNEQGQLIFGTGATGGSVMHYNTIYKVTETTAPDGYVADSEPIYIMVPRIVDDASDYPDYVKKCMQMTNPKINIQYQSTYELTVFNHKGEITVKKKFKDPGGKDVSPVSGTYKFGLYETADGTTEPLQTITITYSAAEKDPKTANFTNLDLTDDQNQPKTYYVFELDDNEKPIKNSATAVTVNEMEYFTSYETLKTAGATTGGNSAVSGDTVTVTNQIRVKELPSTGGYGSLLYRLAGSTLILFAGLLMLINIKKQTCNNRK